MEFKHGVIIGRFQPFHNAHLEVVRKGLEIAQNVIIVIGSANAAPTIKNPFSYDERKTMIVQSLVDAKLDVNRVKVVGVRDYFYNQNAWLGSVQSVTDQFINEGDSVALLGSYKDAASWWLNSFPQWTFVPVKTENQDASAIRERLLREGHEQMLDWEGKLPNPPVDLVGMTGFPKTVELFLKQWVKGGAFGRLAMEHKFLTHYQAQWANAPFPPTFVTTDAVVVCSGHVLVVQRKHNPGKGMYALPGGFVNPNEFIEDAAIRELREETGIRVDKLILQSSIEAVHVFDHPDRDPRGRTISHGHYIVLKDGKLPEVKGGDDAAKALWMPLWDVNLNERKFYGDHTHIINYFTGV